MLISLTTEPLEVSDLGLYEKFLSFSICCIKYIFVIAIFLTKGLGRLSPKAVNFYVFFSIYYSLNI